MPLIDEIQKMRAEIRTDEYSMSVGEWINLYENDELDIHPEFQRFFRWSDYQKSRLIESLLLGIPIPMIFVSQREDGVWDVVDGMQRLSTIFQFVGILRDHDNKQLEPLVLQKTEYLPSLEGTVWQENVIVPGEWKPLDTSQRLQLKRAKISVSIILKESDARSKFDLFQRLNRGGSQLTDQEVRNCILVMVDESFYSWLRELSTYGPFAECIALTDKAAIEQYNMELALRFLVLRKMASDDLRRIGDLNQLLQDRMVEMAQSPSYDRDHERTMFERTFDTIQDALGSDSFRRYDLQRERFAGGFLISGFEMVAIGIGFHAESVDLIDPDKIGPKVHQLWSDNIDRVSPSGGVRASTRIPRTVELGRSTFNPDTRS